MRRNKWARLVVTDGIDTFDFLSAPICLKAWEPAIAQKREIRQQGFQADGSTPVDYAWENINEAMTFNTMGKDGDDLASPLHDLHELLIKGLQYWTTSWQKTPVWIEVRAQHETNVRYGHIVSFQTEKDNDPFAQPYFGTNPYRRNFPLGIEHKHWSANAPGESDCVQLSAQQEGISLFPLVYDGDTQDVTIPAAASLNDLPDIGGAGKGPIQVEGWIKADSYGEGNVGRIAIKGSDALTTRGWHFYIDSVNGLSAIINCATQDAISYSGLDEFTADGLDHHVYMVYDEDAGTLLLPAARTIYLAIDGIWVASYPTQQVSIGAYGTDAADDVVVGNNAGATAGFDGEIGWARILDTILHSPAGGNFTPPARCPLPVSNANTMFLGIREGSGTAIDDAGPNGNDGTAANDDWGDGCEITFGRAATCLDEVYIANKHNVAQLTNIHINDGGAWGPNLVGAATPFNLLPAAPANNDAIYFGIDTAIIDTGPFCSLVFDIGTAATYGAGDSLDWEYWNGAWVALAVQDNTNADGDATPGAGNTFDTTGVASVHWVQPADWATNDPGVGITGYWVRATLTEVTGVTFATQQNRDIYSILWPKVDIDEAQIAGNIEAIARTVIKNQGDEGSGTPNLTSSRILMGLRSQSRGEDFTPYINLADEQNNAGMTISLFGVAAFGNNVETATGREVTVTNPAAAWNTIIEIEFDDDLAPQYRGRFHAFLRGTGGTNIELRLKSQIGTISGYSRFSRNVVSFGAAGIDYIVLDLGAITIPPTDSFSDDDIIQTTLAIDVFGDGADDCSLYDLILMPTDEWLGDYRDIDHTKSWADRGDIDSQKKLDVDGVTYPKATTRALLKIDPSDSVQDIYKSKAVTQIFQNNADQSLWFLFISSNASPLPYDTSIMEVGGSIQAWSNARYLSARGDR
jgi:hypothetical protein